jgi:hypothetical protein
VKQQDDRARAGDTEGTPVAVDRAELQRRRFNIPHRPQMAP